MSAMKRNEPISKIMSADPVTVHEKQKVSEIWHLILEQKIHHVPVVSGKRLIGLISANDVLRVTYDVNRQDPRQVDAMLDTWTVRDVMAEDIATVRKDQTVRDAAEKLAQGGFHSLPVIDGEDLVGMVTSTDLIRYLLDQY